MHGLRRIAVACGLLVCRPFPKVGRATMLAIALSGFGILVGLVRPNSVAKATLAGVIIVTVGAWVRILASVAAVG